MENKEQKIQDINHIKDLAVMVLSHLDKIHTDDAIDEIIDLLDYTPLDNYRDIFEKCKQFKSNHSKYPDHVYLENNFSPRYYYLNWDYSPDIFIDLVYSLKKYKKIKNIQKALEDFDVDKVKDIIHSDVDIKDKDDVTVDNIFECYERLENLPQGLIIGIPELDNYTKGLDYGTMNAIAAPVGTFKCINGNSRVHTSLGYIKIKDISHGDMDEEGFASCSINVRNNEKTSHFYYGGLKDTYNIHSPYFDLEGTPIHRVKILTEMGIDWKQLQNIRIGDYVCLDKNQPLLFNNVTLKLSIFNHLNERDYGWVLGALYGDGYRTNSGNTLGFTGNLESCNIFKKITGIDWSISKDNRKKDVFTLRKHSKELIKELDNIGFMGKADTKNIPEWVYSSNKDFIIGFLSGLIDTDGRICDKEINLNLKSKDLIYGVRDLFNLLGIYPKIKKIYFNYKYKGTSRKEYIYRLTVLKQDSDNIHILNLRTNKKFKLLEYTNNMYINNRNNKSLIPYPNIWKKDIIDLVENKLKNSKDWYNFYKKNRKSLYVYEILNCKRDRTRNSISKLSFYRFLSLFNYEDYCDCQFYKDLNEYNFKPVTQIERGKCEVYDLTVPTTETFMANGIVNHNTTTAVSASYNAGFIQKKKVLYITLEVTPEKVYYDLLARHAYEMGFNLSASDIKKGKLKEEDKEILNEVIEDWKINIGEGCIKVIGVNDIEDYSPAYLESLIKCQKTKMGGLDLVCLDYLNLLKNKIPPRMKMNDPYQALNFYAQFFTDMSIKMQLIMLLLCQVNRDGTAKLDKQAEKHGGIVSASTTFFAEANEVERSASTAMILHATKSMKNNGDVDIILVKNRDGQIPETTIRAKVKPDSFLVGTIAKSYIEQSMDNCLLTEDEGGYDVNHLNDVNSDLEVDIDKELNDEDR